MNCLIKAVNTANKAFTTDDSSNGWKAENKAFKLARGGITTTLGCIYDFGIQELTHLASGHRNNLARDVRNIIQAVIPARHIIPIASDRQLKIV